MILAPRMTILTLGVSDLRIATKFYEETLGWTKSSLSNDNISFFLLPSNGMLLSVYPIQKLAQDVGVQSLDTADSMQGGMPSFRGLTLAYCTTSAAEVDEIFLQLRRKGVAIIKEPEKAVWGGYSGYMADPDHNLWEIAYNPYLALDDNGMVI